jgi:hypothetical protein
LLERFTLITEVEPSQGRDKTPEATDPETSIPEAKTQSRDSSDFSWLAQKVEKRGRTKKVAEGDRGEEEKERRRDATSLGNKWPCPKSRGRTWDYPFVGQVLKRSNPPIFGRQVSSKFC